MSLVELATQDMFELLWFHKDPKQPLPGTRPYDRGWILYHTAKWCKPCQRMAIQDIVKAAEARGLTIWRVDQDVNTYTSGFCDVRSIPTFQFCRPRQIVDVLKPASTAEVMEWIETL